MDRINLYIAQNNYLMNEGYKAVFKHSEVVNYVGYSVDSEAFRLDLNKLDVDVVLMDYASTGFNFSDALYVIENFTHISLIGITHDCNVQAINKLIQSGISGHLLSDCDREEIEQSVSACYNREKFFCGKLIAMMRKQSDPMSAFYFCALRQIVQPVRPLRLGHV